MNTIALLAVGWFLLSPKSSSSASPMREDPYQPPPAPRPNSPQTDAARAASSWVDVVDKAAGIVAKYS